MNAEDIFSPDEIEAMNQRAAALQEQRQREREEARAALMAWGELVSEVPLFTQPKHPILWKLNTSPSGSLTNAKT